MVWSVTRQGGVMHADVSRVEDDEWQAFMNGLDAELVVERPSQLVIHAGARPPKAWREVLVSALETVVEGQGVKVRVVYTFGHSEPAAGHEGPTSTRIVE
jgi:hypothetical protein